MKQTLWLPWPPTANTMFGLKGHRRFISETYATWKEHAGAHLMMQQPAKHAGAVNIEIRLRCKRRIKWDLDNRVKPVLDLLVTYQIIEDDNTDIVPFYTVGLGADIGATITLEDAEG
jgi:Holliday junction resolvase RusA-like endonuclease